MREIEGLAGALEDLRTARLIRAYGWSTDDPDCARVVAALPNCVAVQHTLNLFEDAPALLDLCSANGLASINRSPLAMGVLSGKFSADTHVSADDVRGAGHSWVPYFDRGRPKRSFLDQLASVREILTSEGRTLAQGALAWIWACSTQTVPIPGFKSVGQVEENAGALSFGPLKMEQMHEIDGLLALALTRTAPPLQRHSNPRRVQGD